MEVIACASDHVDVGPLCCASFIDLLPPSKLRSFLRDAQREALSNKVALYHLSCCCVFCERVPFPLDCQQAGSLTKRAWQAAFHDAVSLLPSRCASREGFPEIGSKILPRRMQRSVFK